MRYVVIKVGATHHGAIPPGLLILVPVDKVTQTSGNDVTFENPVSGGFSFGEAVFTVDMEMGS